METHDSQRTRDADIVIVGGGAGGLELAVRLAKAGHKDVLLIDRDTSHVWKPRLHEIAAGLGRRQVDELGYAGLAEQWGFRFECGTLEGVDPEQRQITLAAIPGREDDATAEVPVRVRGYRQLVLALGGVTPDMGVEGVLEHACLLDSPEDAERIAERFSRGLLANHVAMETAPTGDSGASATQDGAQDGAKGGAQESPGRPYQVVIVGSGATGVELAAYLHEARGRHDAPAPKDSRVEITILEATETFMPGVSEELREAIHQRLEAQGINIELSRQVAKVSPGSVEISEGDESVTREADLVVWAAGRVGPAIVEEIEGLASNKKRQWKVTPGLQCLEQEAIFALGDCACIDEAPLPPTAQVASEQAEFLAEELPRRQQSEAAQVFEFKDRGTLLSLARAGSVGELGGKLSGKLSHAQGNDGHEDLQVRGRFARAAYQGLQRQHQFLLLGPLKGSAEVVSDVLRHAMGPRLKVH
ncbi:NAD(P)/FAD-dependent oxidoreductase [Cobetia marina]|uniref:NAD(P)/FAD-dependent oxidoreductase n=1 Tax=Cobetia marina TaxID=28258 RepID=UPI0025475C5A|nr:FAD-dependent oxidoreductase [Cobetia pacifica]MDI6002435.1 FAD-dependent oxidoreductase [Cobetia pacifica]